MLAAATLFLSAFLLFSVQPMLGKAMLPLIGGTPGGWLTILVFFQLSLLAGYALAHVFSRLPLKQHMGFAYAVLLAGVVFLPLGFSHQASLTGPVDLLRLLLVTVSVPAIGLSLLSSTVQRRVAARGQSPYWLYAASNAGSLLGLVSYPLLVEPFFRLASQTTLWTAGYVLLLAVLALVVFGKAPDAQIAPREPISWKQRRMWLVLSAIPASLSYGLASYITLELGSFPLFWIIPLGAYLLSFIIAFSTYAPSVRVLSGLALACFVLTVGMTMAGLSGAQIPDRVFLLLWLVLFMLLATALHTRLAASRPAPAMLSEYYLWLALGGALGGLFNVFVTPVIFAYPFDFFFAGLFALMLLELAPKMLKSLQRLATVGVVLLLVASALMQMQDLQRVERNFFGTMLVFDAPGPGGHKTRFMTTGVGYQGSQQLEPQVVTTPELYFTPLHGFFAGKPFNEIGMLGLGAGMALCFAQEGRHFTVYEIDPKVRRIAERDFTYIKTCGEPEWRMGDGRIELMHSADRKFDLLIIDAFQAVNIPVHLITREALALYLSRLKPDGVLLYNIASIYYDLKPQLAAQANEAGLQVWQASESWVLMAPKDVDLEWLRASGFSPLERPAVSVWSDDWANPLGAVLPRDRM